ncbi:MAG: trehalose-phosphatase [Endomicrobiaceae bacterium]|nr:trehalose-phosphatase [Endomicrobiaceae bacterium]
MENLNSLIETIKRKDKILLIFDYDGTLVPIQDKPDMAFMNPVLRKALENLSKSDCLKIAVVTGRSIKDLKKLSGLNTPDICVFGMHGGEIEMQGKIVNSAQNKKILTDIDDIFFKLKKRCAKIDGIIIENKKYSVALHYRLANEPQPALDIFYDLAKEYEDSGLFKIQKGKKVVELLPLEFSKDKAVLKIIKTNEDYCPVYFGDDVTDISAFHEVHKFAGYAVGIKPMPFKNERLVDFEIEQNELEKFLINLSVGN